MSEADPNPGNRRRRRSPAEIMDRLLAAAEQEFKAGGYTGATTAAIARRAEITEAQLFRYFPSKAALFRQAMVKPLDDHFQNFLFRQNGIGEFAAQRHEGARTYIRELQEFIAEHEKMFRSLVAAEAYAHQNIEGVTVVDSLHEYFEHGARTLPVSANKHPPVAPQLMVRVSFAAVLACAIFRDWLFPDNTADDRGVREAVTEFVLFGLYGEPPAERQAWSTGDPDLAITPSA